ncbi:hypothetical protein JCM8097_007119 [Rhodosporidiobolus ruineniae]
MQAQQQQQQPQQPAQQSKRYASGAKRRKKAAKKRPTVNYNQVAPGEARCAAARQAFMGVFPPVRGQGGRGGAAAGGAREEDECEYGGGFEQSEMEDVQLADAFPPPPLSFAASSSYAPSSAFFRSSSPASDTGSEHDYKPAFPKPAAATSFPPPSALDPIRLANLRSTLAQTTTDQAEPVYLTPLTEPWVPPTLPPEPETTSSSTPQRRFRLDCSYERYLQQRRRLHHVPLQDCVHLSGHCDVTAWSDTEQREVVLVSHVRGIAGILENAGKAGEEQVEADAEAAEEVGKHLEFHAPPASDGNRHSQEKEKEIRAHGGDDGGTHHSCWWLPTGSHLLSATITSPDAKAANSAPLSSRIGNAFSYTVSAANALVALTDTNYHGKITSAYKKRISGSLLDDSLGNHPDFIWSGAALVRNRAVDGHEDGSDDGAGFAAMAPFGAFSGGQLYLPTLGVVIEYRAGDLCLIRARWIKHEVLSFEGPRTALVLFWHAAVLYSHAHGDDEALKRGEEPDWAGPALKGGGGVEERKEGEGSPVFLSAMERLVARMLEKPGFSDAYFGWTA